MLIGNINGQKFTFQFNVEAKTTDTFSVFNITTDAFCETLLSAIEQSEYQELLVTDIEQALQNDAIPERRNSWSNIINHIQSAQQSLSDFFKRYCIKYTLPESFSEEQIREHIELADVWDDKSELTTLSSDVESWHKQRVSFCRDKKVIQSYIKSLFSKSEPIISIACLQLYAKFRHYSLYLWKSNSENSNQISCQGHYIHPDAQKTLHLLFDDKNLIFRRLHVEETLDFEEEKIVEPLRLFETTQDVLSDASFALPIKRADNITINKVTIINRYSFDDPYPAPGYDMAVEPWKTAREKLVAHYQSSTQEVLAQFVSPILVPDTLDTKQEMIQWTHKADSDLRHLGKYPDQYDPLIQTYGSEHHIRLWDIFNLNIKKGGLVQTAKRILLQGRPGSGKTTTVDWLTQQWVVTDNPVIKNYAWVFRIHLRLLAVEHKNLLNRDSVILADILHAYFWDSGTSLNKQQVQSILHKHQPDEILLILDGFNELPDINSSPALPRGLKILLQAPFSTLITSRLCHSEYAKNYCQSDLVINLLGFDERVLRDYVQKRAFILSPDNDVESRKKTDQLMRHLEKQRALWSFSHIPINIYWITRLWLNVQGDVQQLAELSTMTDLFNKITDVVIHEELNRQLGHQYAPRRTIERQNAMKAALYFLEDLAFEAMKTQSWLISQEIFNRVFVEHHRDYPINELAQLLTEDSPFLNRFIFAAGTDKEVIYYTFTHATFQEYFAAQHQSKQSKASLQHFIAQYRFEPHYQMMLIFVAGLISRNTTQNTLLLPAIFQAIDSFPADLTESQSILIRISWLNECIADSRDYLYENYPAIFKKIQEGVEQALNKPEQQWREGLIDFFRYSQAIFFHHSISPIIENALKIPQNFDENFSTFLIQHYRAVRLLHNIQWVPEQCTEELIKTITGLAYHYEARFEAALALAYVESPERVIDIISNNFLSLKPDELWGFTEQDCQILIRGLHIDDPKIADAMRMAAESRAYGLRLKANLLNTLGKLLRRSNEEYRAQYCVLMINVLVTALGSNSYSELAEKESKTTPDLSYAMIAASVSGLGEINFYEGFTWVGYTKIPLEKKAIMEILRFIARTLQSYQAPEIIKTGVKILDNLLNQNPHIFDLLMEVLLTQALYLKIAIAYSFLYLTITSEERQQFFQALQLLLESEKLDLLLKFVLTVILLQLKKEVSALTRYLCNELHSTDKYIVRMALFFIAEFHLNDPEIVHVLLDNVKKKSLFEMIALGVLEKLGQRNAAEIAVITQRYSENKNIFYLSVLAKIGGMVFNLYDILKAAFLQEPDCQKAEYLAEYLTHSNERIDRNILEEILKLIKGSDTLTSSTFCEEHTEEWHVNQRAATLLGRLNLFDYIDIILMDVPKHLLPIALQGTPIRQFIEHFSKTGEWLELCISKAINSSITFLYNEPECEWVENNQRYRVVIENESAREKLTKLTQERQLLRLPSLSLTTYQPYFNQQRGNFMPINKKQLEVMLEQAHAMKITENAELNQAHELALITQKEWEIGRKNNESAAYAQYPFYPTDYECACLAERVYPGSTSVLPAGWELIRTGTNGIDGYIGAAYWHQGHRHLVISHRGTDDLNGWITDAHAVAKGNIDPHMASATKFTLDTIAKMADVMLSITVTGHSLGGWLAQITGYHLAEIGVHAHIVAFESPGAHNMLIDLQQPNREQKVSLNHLDITIYLSTPNYINTCGDHPTSATVYHVPSEIVTRPWKADWTDIRALGYIEYLSSVHSMLHLRNAFDPATGYPRRYYRMQSWPTTTLPYGATNNWKIIQILGTIKDLVVHRNEQQLSEFISFAKALNDLSLSDQSALPFDALYQLVYSAKFRKVFDEPENSISRIVKITALPPKAQEFLCRYYQFKSYFDNATANHLLNSYHERCIRLGYHQLPLLLSDSSVADNKIIGRDALILAQYMQHVIFRDPDLSKLELNILNQVVQQTAEKTKKAPPLLAEKAGRVHIGEFTRGMRLDTKNMSIDRIQIWIPTVEKLASSVVNDDSCALSKLDKKDMGDLRKLLSDSIIEDEEIRSLRDKINTSLSYQNIEFEPQEIKKLKEFLDSNGKTEISKKLIKQNNMYQQSLLGEVDDLKIGSVTIGVSVSESDPTLPHAPVVESAATASDTAKSAPAFSYARAVQQQSGERYSPFSRVVGQKSTVEEFDALTLNSESEHGLK